MPVDPDSNLVPAMQAGAFGLRHGKILVLFPEGERSIDGTVKRFKKGAPILARHLGVPVVPVALHGTYEIWPRNRAFDWSRLLPWSGHRVTVEFGEPMRFGENESYADAALRLRDRVARMWEQSEERTVPKVPEVPRVPRGQMRTAKSEQLYRVLRYASSAPTREPSTRV